MEEALPSLSDGAVGSRFISQNDVESARTKREEQWKAAYARLGQEPPPQAQEEAYDGRSLAEKLAANRVAKQEEWEEKTKLANQFRALEEDEIMFLDSLREKEEAEEKLRKERDGEELQSFKAAVAARDSNTSPPVASSSTAPPKKKAPNVPPKKDLKKSLKGVIVKMKTAKPAATTTPKPAIPAPDAVSKTNASSKRALEEETSSAAKDETPDPKKRKVSSPS